MKALFSSLDPIDVSEDELVLSTAYLYIKDRVEKGLTDAIQDAIWSVSGKQYGFRIIIRDDLVSTSSSIHSDVEPLPATSDKTSDRLDYSLATSERPVLASTSVLPTQSRLEDQFHNPAIPVAVAPLLLGTQPNQVTSLLPNTQSNRQRSLLVDDVQVFSPDNLYQRWTFDTFVVGTANQLAFNMAVFVAEAPGYIMNPLFIYGKSGLGKTHLLLSIRHYILQHNPLMKVIYIQTNELIKEYVDAGRQGDFSGFDQKYFTADVFLLDDVQYLKTGQETANRVFDIFNLLKDDNKQVVLSADCAPSEIDLHDRFLSRFSSGVIADVQPPSYETKVAIFSNYLDYCCRRLGYENIRSLIRPDVVEHIVSLSGSNIRELEGAANNLVFSLAKNQHYLPVTPEEAEALVAHHFRRLESRNININAIQKEVENYFNISHADILSSKRSQDISYPRQAAMYLCRLLTSESLPKIAKAFNKDHTAVMYACNNIEQKRQLSLKVDSEIKEILTSISG